MASISTFLVVWTLLVIPPDGLAPMKGSSHYYWSYGVCQAAARRFVGRLEDEKFSDENTRKPPSSFQTKCVPYMQENVDSGWVFANVIGPCEPNYHDCAGLKPGEISQMLDAGERWYAIVLGRRAVGEQRAKPPIHPSPSRATDPEDFERIQKRLKESR